MKNMFARDPWYNGKAEQGGVQQMGFRPGPVQIAVVRPMPGPAPTFGQVQMTATTGLQPPAPLLAQGMPPQQQGPRVLPQPQQQPRVPMGKKADCPVCRSFGG